MTYCVDVGVFFDVCHWLKIIKIYDRIRFISSYICRILCFKYIIDQAWLEKQNIDFL